MWYPENESWNCCRSASVYFSNVERKSSLFYHNCFHHHCSEFPASQSHVKSLTTQHVSITESRSRWSSWISRGTFALPGNSMSLQHSSLLTHHGWLFFFRWLSIKIALESYKQKRFRSFKVNLNHPSFNFVINSKCRRKLSWPVDSHGVVTIPRPDQSSRQISSTYLDITDDFSADGFQLNCVFGHQSKPRKNAIFQRQEKIQQK